MNLPPPSGEMPCYPPPAFSGHEFSASAAADPTELTITRPLLEEALAAKPALAALSTEEKKAVLLSMADALEADTPAILAANNRSAPSQPVAAALERARRRQEDKP